MSATESLIEWYFKILVRYRGFMKSIPMITMKYHHEISEIMRLDTDYSQSSESWTLGLRTLRSVQSLPTKSLGLTGPISEHFQLYNSDQLIFFIPLSKLWSVIFHIRGDERWARVHRSVSRDTTRRLWEPMMAASTIWTKTDFEGLSVLHRWENDFRSGVRPFLSEFMVWMHISGSGR